MGLGSDGAARDDVSIFEEMKTIRTGLSAAWGLPVFDSTALPNKDILRMATMGGAAAMQMEAVEGAVRPGAKADLILIRTMPPPRTHQQSWPTPWPETAYGSDVSDSIINGKLVMKERQVLTWMRSHTGGCWT